MSSPANWYPDPSGRHEVRYWDGSEWTEHVSDRGVTGRDPVDGGRTAEAVQAAQADQEFEAWRETSDRQAMPVSEPSDPDRSDQTPLPSRPTPIITRAGWGVRTKLLGLFILLDVVVAAFVIWYVAR